jgi:hypothetical protein
VGEFPYHNVFASYRGPSSRRETADGSDPQLEDNATKAITKIPTIKNELVNRSRFTTRDQARLAVFDYIETFYNPRRLHSSPAASRPETRPASPSSTTSRPSTTRADCTAPSATAHPTTTKGANSTYNPLPLPNPKVSTETGQPQSARAE